MPVGKPADSDGPSDGLSAPAAQPSGWAVIPLVARRASPPGSFLTFPFEVRAPAGAVREPVYLCPEADPGWLLVSQPRRLAGPSAEPSEVTSAYQAEPGVTPPGPSTRVLISVRVPDPMVAGSEGRVRLSVVAGEGCDSEGNPLARAESTAVVAVQRGLELQLEGPSTATPGRRWSGRLLVANRGNQEETIELAVRTNLNWPAWLEPARVELAAFGHRTVDVVVQVPEYAGAGLTLVVSVSARTADGELQRTTAARTATEWTGPRGRRRDETEGALLGQLSLQAGWPAMLPGRAQGLSTPSLDAGLRLDARQPQSSWQAGASARWSGQGTTLSWPWLVITDMHGQTWSVATGAPPLPGPLGRQVSSRSLLSLTMPQADEGRLQLGVAGASEGGFMVAQRVSARSAEGRRWAVAAGSWQGQPAVAAEGRMPLWRQGERFADLAAAAAYSGAPAGSLGLEVGSSSVWSTGLWWDVLEAGFVESFRRQRLRLEGRARPAQGRSVAGWVQVEQSDPVPGSRRSSQEFGVRLQPVERLAVEWRQQQRRDGQGYAITRFAGLSLRGGPPGSRWHALASASETNGIWSPSVRLWLPVGRAGSVLWQPSVEAARQSDGLWLWTASAWMRYQPWLTRVALLGQSSATWLENGSLMAANLTFGLERALTPVLAARLGISMDLTPASPPTARVVAGATYQFAIDLPQPRGTVQGRLVGWQEREPTFRWPAVAVKVDGEVAGELQPDGTFVLRGVPAGRRRIELDARQIPAMWMAPPPVEVEVAANREVAVELPVSGAGFLEGTCFADLNEDGVRQPGEPTFGSCVVQVGLEDGPAVTVVADSGGRWRLSGVRPGRYVVRASARGFPEPVREAAGQLAPWLALLATMGSPRGWTWEAEPVTVELAGWPQVTEAAVGLRLPAAAAVTVPHVPPAPLGLRLEVQPETAPPGAELRVRVEADMAMAEVELELDGQRLTLEGSGTQREVWVALPADAPLGAVQLVVRARDGRGQEEEQRALVLVDPQIPLVRARAQPVAVRAGETAQIQLEALARLSRASALTPWGELPMVPDGPAPAMRWTAVLRLPPDAPAGLHTFTLQGLTIGGQTVSTTVRIRVRS